MYKYRILSIDESEAVSHHGILGMHWGIRRYQNKDGSLTAAGKKRQQEMGWDSGKKSSEKKIEKRSLSSLSEEEIIQRMNRINLELSYVNALKELETAKYNLNNVGKPVQNTSQKGNKSEKSKKEETNGFASKLLKQFKDDSIKAISGGVTGAGKDIIKNYIKDAYKKSTGRDAEDSDDKK